MVGSFRPIPIDPVHIDHLLEDRTIRAAIEFFQTPAELGESFRVPQLALRVQGELQLFDDPEVLEYPWDLSPYDAVPTADDLKVLGTGFKVSEGGEIDIDGSGKVFSRPPAEIPPRGNRAY